MSNTPKHPANPKWQTIEEWKKTKQPQTVFLEKEKETDEELLKRFGLKQEEGDNGWGQLSQGGGGGGW